LLLLLRLKKNNNLTKPTVQHTLAKFLSHGVIIGIMNYELASFILVYLLVTVVYFTVGLEHGKLSHQRGDGYTAYIMVFLIYFALVLPLGVPFIVQTIKDIYYG